MSANVSANGRNSEKRVGFSEEEKNIIEDRKEWKKREHCMIL